MESGRLPVQFRVCYRQFVRLWACQSFEVSVFHLSDEETVMFPLHLCLAAKSSVSCMYATMRTGSGTVLLIVCAALKSAILLIVQKHIQEYRQGFTVCWF